MRKRQQRLRREQPLEKHRGLFPAVHGLASHAHGEHRVVVSLGVQAVPDKQHLCQGDAGVRLELAHAVCLVDAAAGDIDNAAIALQVNGADRQGSNVSKLIWNIGEIIEYLSAAWELAPGDLIYSGTPEGVAAVVQGDTLVGTVTGLETLSVKIT